MKVCVLARSAPISERPLETREVPESAPGAGQLRVSVEACAICRTDLHIVEGALPPRKSCVVPGHQIVGQVDEVGGEVDGFHPGDRVGIAWLHHTCGFCRFCRVRRENLCENAEFTGWTVDGGFAEKVIAPASHVYRLPETLPALQAAPLLCAGIIGYRALRLTGVETWEGARLGIWGFGAAGHVAIQVALARGASVLVNTRDPGHQDLASGLGAEWVGGPADRLPHRVDAAIIFAPAGELVPRALESLDKAGTLVLGGIHMSPTPPLDYDLLYQERVIRSVANNTRQDGREFLEEAARIPVRTHTETFAFPHVNEALGSLRHGAIQGAGVITFG